MRFHHERLKKLRKANSDKEETRSCFAIKFFKKTGKRVSYQTVTNWCDGVSCPSFDNVLYLCKYYDVPITEFVKED